MVYTDEGKKIQVYESTVERLKHIARFKPVGRLEVSPPWNAKDVRQLEDQGFIRVRWLERGDTERKHAWDITDITSKGREIIRAWDARAARKETDMGEKQ